MDVTAEIAVAEAAVAVAGGATVTKEDSPHKTWLKPRSPGCGPYRRVVHCARKLWQVRIVALAMCVRDRRILPACVRICSNVHVDAPSPAHVDCRHPCAPVAQLDRAVASGATGREFESLRAHHFPRFTAGQLRSLPSTY